MNNSLAENRIFGGVIRRSPEYSAGAERSICVFLIHVTTCVDILFSLFCRRIMSRGIVFAYKMNFYMKSTVAARLTTGGLQIQNSIDTKLFHLKRFFSKASLTYEAYHSLLK